MCGCNKNKNINRTCGDVSISLLNDKKAILQCAIDNSYFEEIGMTEEYLNSHIEIINLAIADKLINPGSCTYSTQITQINSDVVIIIANTDCS